MDNVKVKRQGILIEASPASSLLPLVEEFQFNRLIEDTDVFGRRRGYKAGPTTYLYQFEEDKDRIIFPAGLAHRFFSKLTSSKIPYEYHDLRAKEWPDPDFENIFRKGYRLRPGQAELLGKLATCDMGRIDNPTGDGKSFIITMMVLMFPVASILIVTDGLEPFGDMYDMLMEVTPDVGRMGGGHSKVKRVTLCNKDSLHKIPGEEFDFCLVDECHVMAAPKTAPKFSRITNAKIFGFSATQAGRHDNSDLLIEAMFGPIIHQVPYQLSRSRGNVSQIQVAMYDCPYGPDLSSTGNPTTRKRRAYWRNDDRNQLIAHIARNVIPKDDQQLIVVDTIEHALYLKKLLPGWVVVYSAGAKDKMQRFISRGLTTPREILKPNDAVRIKKAFRRGSIKRVIVNSVWHKAMDFPRLEYLIRADGGRSSIGNLQISGRLSRLFGDNLKHLIDFTDRFDRVAYDRSIARKRSYKKQGWSIIEQSVAIPDLQAVRP